MLLLSNTPHLAKLTFVGSQLAMSREENNTTLRGTILFEMRSQDTEIGVLTCANMLLNAPLT